MQTDRSLFLSGCQGIGGYCMADDKAKVRRSLLIVDRKKVTNVHVGLLVENVPIIEDELLF
jgi:hypothetical protein